MYRHFDVMKIFLNLGLKYMTSCDMLTKLDVFIIKKISAGGSGTQLKLVDL
jgi:hypothetical protein